MWKDNFKPLDTNLVYVIIPPNFPYFDETDANRPNVYTEQLQEDYIQYDLFDGTDPSTINWPSGNPNDWLQSLDKATIVINWNSYKDIITFKDWDFERFVNLKYIILYNPSSGFKRAYFCSKVLTTSLHQIEFQLTLDTFWTYWWRIKWGLTHNLIRRHFDRYVPYSQDKSILLYNYHSSSPIWNTDKIENQYTNVLPINSFTTDQKLEWNTYAFCAFNDHTSKESEREHYPPALPYLSWEDYLLYYPAKYRVWAYDDLVFTDGPGAYEKAQPHETMNYLPYAVLWVEKIIYTNVNGTRVIGKLKSFLRWPNLFALMKLPITFRYDKDSPNNTEIFRSGIRIERYSDLTVDDQGPSVWNSSVDLGVEKDKEGNEQHLTHPVKTAAENSIDFTKSTFNFTLKNQHFYTKYSGNDNWDYTREPKIWMYPHYHHEIFLPIQNKKTNILNEWLFFDNTSYASTLTLSFKPTLSLAPHLSIISYCVDNWINSNSLYIKNCDNTMFNFNFTFNGSEPIAKDVGQQYFQNNYNRYNTALLANRLGLATSTFKGAASATFAGYGGLLASEIQREGGISAAMGQLGIGMGLFGASMIPLDLATQLFRTTRQQAAMKNDLANHPNTISNDTILDHATITRWNQFYMVEHQLPEIDQKILSNYFNLYGYACELREQIKDHSYFQTRKRFDFIMSEDITDAITEQTIGIEVQDWFAKMFQSGMRLFHQQEDKKFHIFEFDKENWEIWVK